mmetsp:Transcript_39008/g.62854  ORF Transcript_39008/g.62854 Transcript_39008/m.62854 type:complete len:131 (-) Transcript_39008:654-1046(-)
MCIQCPYGTHACGVGALNCAVLSPASEYTECELPYTLKQFRDRSRLCPLDVCPTDAPPGIAPRFKTGGLGKLMEAGVFEVYVCVQGHPCSGSIDAWFCWVLDERKATPYETAPDQWVAWGRTEQLKLLQI